MSAERSLLLPSIEVVTVLTHTIGIVVHLPVGTVGDQSSVLGKYLLCLGLFVHPSDLKDNLLLI